MEKDIDVNFMLYCVQLTFKGIKAALPNPCVGACLVYNGQIIGEGITAPFGGAHAEVNAIASVSDKSLLAVATLYVTLEPCSHFGKTPPCANLIIASGIKKVVVGALDPNPLVNGKGIEILRKAGIEVILLELEACQFANRRFLNMLTKKRPYIVLKWAETKDGYLDKIRTPENTGINWITDSSTNKLTHQWRSNEAAILVGTKTVQIDNPSLTVRNVVGENPVRIVIDKQLVLDEQCNIFNNESKTLILNEIKTEVKNNMHWIKIDFTHFFEELFQLLTTHKLNSLIVEGGKETLQRFLDANIYDEIRILVGTNSFETGLKSVAVDKLQFVQIPLPVDTLKIHFNPNFSSKFIADEFVDPKRLLCL